MRITDRLAENAGLERRRRFAVATECDDTLRPGQLVCLLDVHGNLLAAKQGTRGNWELSTQPRLGRFSSLPPESLFVILRRGAHIGFQCLG